MGALADYTYGPVNPQIGCPHCGKAGSVHTKGVKLKKGVSGGKATGAVLTGGLSTLATGLSRKEKAIQAHCDNCGVTWHIG
jgi:transcription elongation factor Elf1